MLSRAGRRLLEARTSAEVVEAKKLAEIALHLAKVTNAARETHADCLRIITRAEIRMADEIDAGQERGEIATADRHLASVRSPDTAPLTLNEINVSRQRLSEWRETRDAGEVVVNDAIKEALAAGRAPTKADIRRKVRGTQGTGETEWYTPAHIIHLARSALEVIDLDPASCARAQIAVKANAFFTKADNGLTRPWHGNVWLNPPYAQPYIEQFADKMVAELRAGRVKAAIMLTHNYTDTAWFQKLIPIASAICFTRGRIRFQAPDGRLASPTQGQALFYFGNRAERFAEVFSELGAVMPHSRSAAELANHSAEHAAPESCQS
ncbi:DNA N-6-adenine-methyltransferase [Bradyrhizobium symbiodeficiens]|uniref:DNA N-6-adenine-methyltransferase n=1 Tax=Bradyrhizobium symbiodeficiens TaxID=1404367 RepID=UPI00139040D2|nr:DNA N-6-adenine-methyltransferase [Bradyrhizobium symbiodeficiens]